MPYRNEYIRQPVWELQIRSDTATMPLSPLRIYPIPRSHSAGDTAGATCTGQIGWGPNTGSLAPTGTVAFIDNRPPGVHLKDLQNQYKHDQERLAIIKAAQQAMQEPEPEPEPEPEDSWDDFGGISEAQARLVRLNIGHPRRR